MTEILLALLIFSMVFVLPALSISFIYRKKGYVPKYLAIGFLSMLLGLIIPNLVDQIFWLLQYEAYIFFDNTYCVANHWLCSFVDFSFENSWWLKLAISSFLLFSILRLVVAIKQNFLFTNPQYPKDK